MSCETIVEQDRHDQEKAEEDDLGEKPGDDDLVAEMQQFQGSSRLNTSTCSGCQSLSTVDVARGLHTTHLE